MLLALGILFGSIFLYKAIMGIIIKHAMANQTKIINVSVMTVKPTLWETKLASTGSLRAVRGVDVTSELAGMVRDIVFTPGAEVTQGELLVQLNADTEIAQLHALEANVELAEITYKRDQAQYAIKAVSKQIVDTGAANLKNLKAQVAQQAAIVAKKSIRAPFSGRLGINYVNPGQYINPGDKIVSLQTMDPIYIDFFIPQQYLAQLKTGQTVSVTTNAWPNRTFKGTITTINPAVDVSTRNIEVEATIDNPDKELKPGLFAQTDISTGKAGKFLTIPQTAVTFNPYGSIVYIVRQSGKAHEKEVLTAKQHFVTTGETRGEQIQVLKGLSSGDVIVTSGQLKLKNNSQVAINNQLAPGNNPAPELDNDH